ncbi:hypothetical protein DDE18_21310 [Nocardioides gansuensis]|uniref:VOC domain-containing protein n=1 Tax=Nocardioides gansuensis TaxID=2138300 RepID=A0A2T8F508_9ACTN|nr:hypothetical protein [Nocardioides gansuensis]PVG80792.1 hypothetical protein DDE18_21310 [Nocardioides gansuensis]
METPRLFGPLISTGEASAHVRLFSEVFGMMVEDQVSLSPVLTADLLGGPEELGAGAEVTVLRTPGVESGVVLVAFDPTSPETIRDWESRVSRDALKVIDFYAPDYEGAIAHARGLGYEVVEFEASYELPEGTFREAHLWGPDHVVTAFLGGPAEFFADFAQVVDGRVSEVQSISAPLTDAQPSVDFYREVLGWDVVYEYAIDDPSFAEMVGVEELRLRSRNVGPSTREPYFGLIDYGLPPRHDGSLRGRSAAPRRGLLGAVLTGVDLDALVSRAGPAAGPVVDCPTLLGHSRGLLLGTPHSVPHLALGA